MRMKAFNMKEKALALVALSAFVLSGCSAEKDGDVSSKWMQAAYDTSLEAREYTDALLAGMLEEIGVTYYDIELTSGGFITDAPVVYIVGYRYSYGDITETYGYKLRKTESGFSVLEESREIGAVITGDNE